jgi:hypothetical protein
MLLCSRYYLDEVNFIDELIILKFEGLILLVNLDADLFPTVLRDPLKILQT